MERSISLGAAAAGAEKARSDGSATIWGWTETLNLAILLHVSAPLVGAAQLYLAVEGCPSGQREQTVNLPA
jgi:hypothetical protein